MNTLRPSRERPRGNLINRPDPPAPLLWSFPLLHLLIEPVLNLSEELARW